MRAGKSYREIENHHAGFRFSNLVFTDQHVSTETFELMSRATK